MAGRGRGLDIIKPAWMAGSGGSSPASIQQTPPSNTPASSQYNPPPASSQYNPPPTSMPSSYQQAPAIHAQRGGGSTEPAVEEVWSEHVTPDGKTYYFNKLTNQSVWTKPPGFHSACAWKEYTTDDGKKYYHNHLTNETTWEMPAEYAQFKDRLGHQGEHQQPQQAHPVQSNPAIPQTTSSSSSSSLQSSSDSVTRSATPSVSHPPAQTPAAAIGLRPGPNVDLFCKMLADKKIDPNMTWEEAMPLLINDPRYKALSTLIERKQTFHDWSERIQKDEKERNHEEIEKKVEAFRKALIEDKEIPLGTTYYRAVSMLQNNPAFKDLHSDVEREFIYESVMLEKEKTHREKTAAEEKEWEAKFKKLLASSGVNSRSQWRKVKSQLAEEEAYKHVSPLQRLRLFEEYTKKLEVAELENERMEREKHRRFSRKCRQNFRKLLLDQYQEDKFTIRTPWKDFASGILQNPVYLELLEADGSTPGELYGDFQEEMENGYDPIRHDLNKILRHSDFNLTDDTTEEELFDFLRSKDEKLVESMKESLRKVYYEDCVYDRKKDKERAARKKESEKKRYMDLLHHKRVDKNSTWEETEERLAKHSAYKDLDENLRKEYFDEFVATAPERKEERRSKSPSSRNREKDRDKRRSHHHRSSHRDRDRDHSDSRSRHRHRSRSKESRSRRDKSHSRRDEEERERGSSKSRSSKEREHGRHSGSKRKRDSEDGHRKKHRGGDGDDERSKPTDGSKDLELGEIVE